MKKSRIEPITLFFSIIAGVIWLFIGNLIENSLLDKLWSPLVIAIYFGGLAVMLILIILLCTKIKGLCMPRENAYSKALLIATGIFFAAGLFQFAYSITIHPQPKDRSSYVFLIDDSASIYDPNGLRNSAVKQVMASCELDFPYAVYSFTNNCQRISDMQEAKNASTTNLLFEEDGGTDIVNAISVVVDEIETGNLNAGSAPRILLITDGQADRTGLRKTLTEAVKNNISICTIDMSGDSNSLLHKIADLSGGKYVSISDVNQLPAAVQGAAVSTDEYVRTLISAREPMVLDWLYAIMRMLFLLCLGAGYIWIKSLLLRTNDSDADVLIPNVLFVVVGALCIEVGDNILFLPEKIMRLIMCVCFAILLTKEVRVSVDEYELYDLDDSQNRLE